MGWGGADWACCVRANGDARPVPPPPLPDTFAAAPAVAGFLIAARPRRVAWGLRWAAKSQAASLHRLLVGGVFTVFGTIIALVTIPWRLPQQWWLATPAAVVVPGVVERVTDDPASPYTDRSVAYVFSYVAPDGEHRSGHCFTSGPQWRAGEALRVRVVPGSPARALPEGGRFDENSPVGLLAVLPGGIGYAMFFGGLVRRRRAVWLLRHGEPHPVRVSAVEATRLTINGVTAFRIEYHAAASDGAKQAERHTDSEIVELAREALRRKRVVFLLVDPRRPRRTLWIESLL